MALSLVTRVERLEATKPQVSPLSHLSDSELADEMFILCRQLHEQSVELDSQIALLNPKCRQFVSDKPWLRDRTHRMGVFLESKEIVFGLDPPDQERIESILNLGWGDAEIDENDTAWLISELRDIDLGEETPWFKEYLERSGK